MLAALAVVAGCAILTIGLILLFVRVQLLSASGLSDRALTALDDPVIRERLSTRITDTVRERMPAHVHGRMTDQDISRAVDQAIEQPAFRTAFASAVRGATTFLVDGRTKEIRLPLDEITEVLTPHLAAIDPQVATQTEEFLRGQAIMVVRSDGVGAVARTLQLARTLGVVLPIAAALCFASAFLLARRRTTVATGVGVSVLVAGVAVVIATRLGRRVARSAADPVHADVAAAIWSAFAGPLSTWGVITAVVGGVILVAGLVLRPAPKRSRHLFHG